MALNVVVVGAGQAACSFASKLRELAPDCRITLIGEEASLPYQRPPLSKKYMTGEMAADRLLLRPGDWYGQARIDCILSTSVTHLDAQAHRITLADGRQLGYDRLLLATGSEPRRLPVAVGGDLQGVYVLRNLADADALAPEMRSGRRVLVIGGGYIGLEAAAVASTLGLEVMVAEMADRILQRVAAPATSDFFRQLHRSRGVRILEGKALVRLLGSDGRVNGAEFADGERIDVDFVLVGIGVTPHDRLARIAGLGIDNGIAVDLTACSSDPHIYAAGDCASFEFRGRRIRLESVQNAIEQGEIAARAIAGETVRYAPIPWFWSDQFDTKLQIAGLNIGYDQTVIRAGARPGTQSVWYFSDGRFIALDAMNDSRTYMFGKRLLELGRTISPAQAGDPAFDLKAAIS